MAIRCGWLLAGLALLLPGAARADWLQVKSQHFLLYGEGSERSLRNFAQDLEKFDALLRLMTGVEKEEAGGPVEVFLLSSQSTVSALAGNPNAAGFFSTSDHADYAVLSHGSGSGAFAMSTESILFHEYAHHFMAHYFPSTYPAWYVEGFAGFFENVKFYTDGSIEFGLIPGERIPGLAQDRGYPLKQLFARNAWGLNLEDADRYYGMAWILTHYLQSNPERQAELKAYLAALARGVADPDPNRYFAGGLAGLQKDVYAYMDRPIHGLRIKPIQPKDDAVGPIAVTPLDPVRGMLIEDQIRLMRHVDARDVPGLVEAVRKIATRYPDNAWAATMLAEALWYAGDKAGALASAERATVLDPTLFLAWSDRAVGLLDKARISHSSEDWAAARAAIIKANRMDTEDPVPLLSYYQYYVLKGDAIPQSAYDGLAKAFALLPQNANYRVTYAEASAHRGDYARASRLLEPLIYSPHSSERRQELLRLKAEFDAAAAKQGGGTTAPATPLPTGGL